MKISEKGLDFIKLHEGFKTEWYDLDDGGLTVGFGNFISYAEAKKCGIKKGQKITEEEAHKMLHEKLDSFVDGVNAQVKEYDFKLNQNQFDALVSYAYNRGLGVEDGSNGLRQLLSHSKSVKDIADNFTVYWGTNEQYKKGLLNRRKLEQALFEEKYVEPKEEKKKEPEKPKKSEEPKDQPKKPEKEPESTELDMDVDATPGNSSTALQYETYRVVVESLNIRETASDNGTIVGTLTEGDEIKVASIDRDGWAKIQHDNDHAFVYAEYIKQLNLESPFE